MKGDIVERECMNCGDLIPYKRLQIIPNTKYCVDCLNDGQIIESFSYKARRNYDEEGNMSIEVITDENEWKAVQEDLAPLNKVK